MMVAKHRPTADERFLFDSQGYLVANDMVSKNLVCRLKDCLRNAIAERRHRELQGNGKPQKPDFSGRTDVNGNNTRLFHILDDDPLFLEMVDYPPLVPYIHALLSNRPHFHASDGLWEREKERTRPAWDRWRIWKPGSPHSVAPTEGRIFPFRHVCSESGKPDPGSRIALN